MKEIKVTDIPGVKIGQVEDASAGTGCSVAVFPEGAFGGVDIRGGGPASREVTLLDSLTSDNKIHAIVLSGGSAFGLDAAGGVMQYLEEHDIGYNVGVAKVPLICQSCIFDLNVGDAKKRPDKAMGYEAAKAAFLGNYKDGNYGAGCGASVGKIAGMSRAMKSGIGSYAMENKGLIVGAMVVVNAVGDVYEPDTGKIIAGMLNEDKTDFGNTVEYMYEKGAFRMASRENTTIGIIFTNAAFNKAKLSKIAGMGQNGLARAIRPVHTSADGDSLYAVSLGDFEAEIDVVGTLAADVVAEAIVRAVKAADDALGLRSIRS